MARVNTSVNVEYPETEGIQEKRLLPAQESSEALESMGSRFWIALLKTFCMTMLYIGLGCSVGVAYATVVDMREAYHSTYDRVASAQMMKAVGVMTGSLTGGPIADRFRKQIDLFLFFFSVLFAVSLGAIPWAPNLPLVGFLFFVNGLCHSTINICCMTVCIAVWRKRAPSSVIALHTAVSAGITISPLVTAPFLSKPAHNTTGENSTFEYPFHDPYGQLLGFYEHEDTPTNMTATRMKIPYGIFGGWSLLSGSIFLIFFLSGTTYEAKATQERKSLKEMFNPAACAQGRACFGVYFIASLFFCYVCSNGRDRGFGMFLFTIANKTIGMSKPVAAWVMFSFNAVGTFGRASCAIISRWIPVQILLMIMVLAAVVIQTLIVFYGLKSGLYLWILCCVMSLFITPLYPTLMSWADRYIEMRGVVIAIINVGIAAGGLSGMYLSGYIYQHFKAKAVFELALLYGAVLCIIVVPLQIISHLVGDRHLKLIEVTKKVTDLVNAENCVNQPSSEDLGGNDKEQLIN